MPGPELLALTGLEPADLAPVVEALGYARTDAQGYVRQRSQRRHAAGRQEQARPAASPFAALRGLRVSG